MSHERGKSVELFPRDALRSAVLLIAISLLATLMLSFCIICYILTYYVCPSVVTLRYRGRIGLFTSKA